MVNAAVMSKPVSRCEIKALGAILGMAAAPGAAFAQTLDPISDPLRLDQRRVSVPDEDTLPVLDEAFGEPAEEPLPEAFTVHLASYFNAEDAVRGWAVLTARHPDLLSGQEPILRDVDLGEKGLYVRLLAGPLSGRDEAVDLCTALRREGAYCVPAGIAGDLVPSFARAY